MGRRLRALAEKGAPKTEKKMAKEHDKVVKKAKVEPTVQPEPEPEP